MTRRGGRKFRPAFDSPSLRLAKPSIRSAFDSYRLQLRSARLAFAEVELNIFFSPLRPSDSFGHSHENVSLAQLAALRRSLAAACFLLVGRCTGSGTFGMSLFKEACCISCGGAGGGSSSCCCFAVRAAAMLLRRWFSR